MKNVIITAGPTYEPLDDVRRLTNHSTGRLGTELANTLTSAGFSVTLLRGYYATYQGSSQADTVIPFTTTDSLLNIFRALSESSFDAVFHAAAVSDFQFGNITPKEAAEGKSPQNTGKWSTRSGSLIAELIPTIKILSKLRGLFQSSLIVGWKYEVDGDRASAINKGGTQLKENETDLSIVNGPAYGDGFALMQSNHPPVHANNRDMLYSQLLIHLNNHSKNANPCENV